MEETHPSVKDEGSVRMLGAPEARGHEGISAATPSRDRFARRGWLEKLEPVVLPMALVGVTVLFGALRPDTFLTQANFAAMLSSQAVLVVLAMGLIVPLIASEYDVSVGAVTGLSAMIIAVLNVEHNVPITLAIASALAAGIVVGMVNGAITVYFGIESLIVTLGMANLVAGTVLLISGQNTITGISQRLVNAVVIDRLFGIPLEFYYSFVLCAILWYVLEYVPVGKRLLVVGRNREVARLSGINVRLVRWGSFIAASFLASVAGVLYAGTSGAADPSSTIALLLPAFAAAFLGATTITPGRFNAWGSLVAVYFLVFGITGLQLLGAETYVQDIFYGGALVVAVIFSQLTRGRRSIMGGPAG